MDDNRLEWEESKTSESIEQWQNSITIIIIPFVIIHFSLWNIIPLAVFK